MTSIQVTRSLEKGIIPLMRIIISYAEVTFTTTSAVFSNSRDIVVTFSEKLSLKLIYICISGIVSLL